MWAAASATSGPAAAIVATKHPHPITAVHHGRVTVASRGAVTEGQRCPGWDALLAIHIVTWSLGFWIEEFSPGGISRLASATSVRYETSFDKPRRSRGINMFEREISAHATTLAYKAATTRLGVAAEDPHLPTAVHHSTVPPGR